MYFFLVGESKMMFWWSIFVYKAIKNYYRLKKNRNTVVEQPAFLKYKNANMKSIGTQQFAIVSMLLLCFHCLPSFNNLLMGSGDTLPTLVGQ